MGDPPEGPLQVEKFLWRWENERRSNMNLFERIEYLKSALEPWKGMTISEAQRHGFGEREMELQIELWWLGYRLNELMRK